MFGKIFPNQFQPNCNFGKISLDLNSYPFDQNVDVNSNEHIFDKNHAQTNDIFDQNIFDQSLFDQIQAQWSSPYDQIPQFRPVCSSGKISKVDINRYFPFNQTKQFQSIRQSSMDIFSINFDKT